MVSFLIGLDKIERNNFLSYLDNLGLDKTVFIKSFNEIINRGDLFENGNWMDVIERDGKRQIFYHYGILDSDQDNMGKMEMMIKLVSGSQGVKNISHSRFVLHYTPEEPIEKIEFKSFFGSKTVNVYKSDIEGIYLFQVGKEGRGYFDFVNELKQETHKYSSLEESEIEFLIQLDNHLSKLLDEWYKKFSSHKNKVTDILSELDKDHNGQLDFIEGGDDFLPLLKKHQSKIVEIDRTYIQQFIKVSNYLSQKKQNLQDIFERLKDSLNPNHLDELGEILEQEIYSYNIILLNSLHMINSLVEDDMITFYDIYEKFDKLNMFNSNWENEVSEKLDEVNLNLVELIKELRDVGYRIVDSIDNLSYITEESTRQLTSKMEEIDSTLKVSNLINLIQTYQMYKINKNTKSLRG